MILFIFGISLLIVGLIAGLVMAINKIENSTSVIIVTVCLAIIMIICSCIASVPTGHTGIVTTFGKVENYTLDAGIHFTVPWKSVVNMDNRVQKATLDLMAFSKDIQEVRVKYTLNYQINKDNAQELYRNVGKDYYDTVVTPIVAESVKAAASKYNAEGLVGDRNELTANIEVILSESLKQYDIEVVSTAVEDLDFTDAFTNAVEAKQVAQQDKLRAITEQERLTVEKQAEADRQVIDANAAAEVAKIQAQADLEVTKIQADAAEYAGLKEAMKNKAISEWLTDTLIQYYYIQQWDGKLPETYVGSEDVSTIVGMK
jgi:regulator of protease activity HflC (stomatin/prohibitin superfamily)